MIVIRFKRCVDMIIMRIAGQLHDYHDDCWAVMITVVIMTVISILFFSFNW